jgi:hypothetical protein
MVASYFHFQIIKLINQRGMAKINTSETGIIHEELTELLKNKIVVSVKQVSCDEGFVIHFSDGVKLEVGWSSPYGEAGVNGEWVGCDGVINRRK